SVIAACTFVATSRGSCDIPCAFLACSAPFAITSATSLPSITKLQPGTTSPHRSTLAITGLLGLGVPPEKRLHPRQLGSLPQAPKITRVPVDGITSFFGDRKSVV